MNELLKELVEYHTSTQPGQKDIHPAMLGEEFGDFGRDCKELPPLSNYGLNRSERKT
jgi:hypothetical protein